MEGDPNRGKWQMTTDRDRIERWAEDRGAVPVLVERADGETDLRLVTDPEDEPGDALAWGQFFDRLEARGRALRYREAASERETAWEIVDHESTADRDAAEAKTRKPDDVADEAIATGDTGEGEPVAFDRVESEDAGTAGRVDEAGAAEERDEAGTPMAESAGGASDGTAGLVLDEIHEVHTGPGSADVADEYLVFENAGDRPVDLSGWTVENEAGRSYRFPEGYTLDPGDRVTLHSGDGRDDEGHLHWGADEPVWDADGDTVTVRTGGGERVLEEPFKR